MVDDPEEAGFMVTNEINTSGENIGGDKNTLILDSGASKTTVCDYNLLIDPKPIKKEVNNSRKINITHVGKFNIGGTLIYPAFFAPDGPCKLSIATRRPWTPSSGKEVFDAHLTWSKKCVLISPLEICIKAMLLNRIQPTILCQFLILIQTWTITFYLVILPTII